MSDSKSAGASRRHLDRRSQESAAVLNKLIRPQTAQGGQSSANRATVPDQHELMPFVREQMQRRIDSDNVFDILPDVQFAADIVISSILSSKDLITTTLIYECTSQSLPLELKSEMLKVVQDYFTKTKPIKNFLYEMLFTAMYKSGSYAVGIIPESSVDQIINEGGKVSLEHVGTGLSAESALSRLQRALGPVGLVGPITADTSKVGIEAIFGSRTPPTKDMLTFEVGGTNFTITDNVDVLKVQKLHQRNIRSKVDKRKNVALEAAGLNFNYYDKDVYKDRRYGHKNVEEVRPVEQNARLTVGHPLEQIFPSESIIPVCVPGNVRHHMGYLCVLDDLGYPISKHSLMNNSAAVSWIFSNPQSASIDDAAKSLGFGDRPDNEKWTAAKLVESYTELVEAKLIASLKNGEFGDSVNLVKPQEVYRIMMARALAKKHTQILYIPAEQMCYFALEYDDFGMGRSLVDKTKLIGTIRTALMMATMQASVLNATRETEYTITLDPNDRDGEKTIRNIEQGIMEAFANDIPYSGTPDDMAAYFSRAGVRFNIEGNDYYPSTKVSKNDNNPDYKAPDKEVEEMYQRMHLRGMLADPDTIMNPENIEFAAQVTSKSILNAKRIIMVQERIAPQITHYVKTYTISDGILLRKLANLARDYYTAEVKAKATAAVKEAAETDNALNPENLDSEAVDHTSTGDGYPFGGEVDDNGIDGTEGAGESPDRAEGMLREKINHAVSHFIETINIELPPPENSMLNSQKQAFDDRAEALDKFLEHMITDEAVKNTELEGDVDRARTMIKSYLLRVWMRDNDVDRDLQGLFETDSVEEVLANIVENNLAHADWVIRLLKKQNDRMATLSANRDVEGTGDSSGDAGGGADQYSAEGEGDETGDGSSADDGLGDFGGDDNFGDFGGGETATEGEDGAETESEVDIEGTGDETATDADKSANADDSAEAAGTGDGTAGDAVETEGDTVETEGDTAHQEVADVVPEDNDMPIDLDEHGTLAEADAEQASEDKEPSKSEANKQDNANAEGADKSSTSKPEEKPEGEQEKKTPETKKEDSDKA